MNSNGNAPKKVSVKKKKPLKQRVALWLVKKIEGNGKKETPPKHAVKVEKKPQAAASRQTQNRTVRSVGKAPDAKRANRRPTSSRPVNIKSGKTVPMKKRSAGKPTGTAVKKPLRINVKKLQKMKNKLYIGAAAVILLLIMIILSRTVLFKIDSIEITNPSDVSYTGEQIKTETGIVLGARNLFSCDIEKVERNIEQRLPYIGDAVVERDFPSSLRVTVTPTSVSAAIVHGAGYLLIDENGKILEYTQVAPEAVPMLRIDVEISTEPGHYLGDVSKLEKGQETNDEIEMIKLYTRVKDAAEGAGLLDGITLIDIRDERAITLMYENRLTLHLGNEAKLDEKLMTGAKTIAAETDSERNRTGAINLETVGIAYVVDTFEEMTEAETEDSAND